MDHAAARLPADRLQLFSSRLAVRRGERGGTAVAGAGSQPFAVGWRSGPDIWRLVRGDYTFVSVCRDPSPWAGKGIGRVAAARAAPLSHVIADCRKAHRGGGSLVGREHSGAVLSRFVEDIGRTSVVLR